MSRADIERRLDDVSRRLRKAREDLSSIDAELSVVGEEADDAKVRALVSDHRDDQRTAYEASKHRTALERARAQALADIDDLRRQQDDLLERLPAAT